MRILFVSNSRQNERFYNDPSARYRCIFPAEVMRHAGINAAVCHIAELNAKILKHYSIVIFHRPSYSLRLAWLLSMAKRHQIMTIADFDDLIFDKTYVEYSPAVLSGGMLKDRAAKMADSYGKALRMFERCLVSTEPLAHAVRAFHSSCHVHVVFNRLPKRWAALSRQHSDRDRFSKKILRYLPGTSHHDHDFSIVLPVLVQFLKKHSEVTLEVVGPLRFSQKSFPAAQVRQRGFVRFEHLPLVIADSWITIAPLVKNPFNQCKSGLKFWESALWGVPVIASSLPDMERQSNDGLFIASTDQEWHERLEYFLDIRHYSHAAQAAQAASKSCLLESIPDERQEIFHRWSMQ